MTPLRNLSSLLACSALLVACSPEPSGVPLISEARAGESPAQALYDQATTAQEEGRIKKALKSYKTINTRFPQSSIAAEATYRYAKLLESDNELLDAFEAYDDLLTKYPASTHYGEAIERQEELAHQAAQGVIRNTFIGLSTSLGSKKITEMLAQVRDNAPQAPSAPKAQFTIAEVLDKQSGKADEAIEQYRQLVREYPDSEYAPEAQYRIGDSLVRQSSQGNADAANIDRARKAFDDLLLRYPNHPRAVDAKKSLERIRIDDIKRSFEIAEFYRKKGQLSSAVFYYQETVRKSDDGELKTQAQNWIKKLGS